MNGRVMEIKPEDIKAYKQASGGKWYLERYFRISHQERKGCYNPLYELNKERINAK